MVALFAGPGRCHPSQARGGAQGFAAWLNETVISPFREFLGRHGAVLILLFVLIYKVGDEVGQGMLNPMIVELGFSDTEFVAITKGVGFVALIICWECGAPFISSSGMGRALRVWGRLVMFSNLLFA